LGDLKEDLKEKKLADGQRQLLLMTPEQAALDRKSRRDRACAMVAFFDLRYD
jgi:hypothetical protein